ncbi:MAG: Fibronectin type domain protein [Pedosphaera sp.]|nr:Fibronectin type domain protein [Pedosphaera sp.]
MFLSLIRKTLSILAVSVLLHFSSAPVSAVIRDGGIDPANLGKGEWVWYMSDTTNKLSGNVASVTNETSLMLYYKSRSVRYMIVKAATNDKLFNGTYGSPQFNSQLVNIAHANGILIFGYNRSYGSNVLGEIAISDYVFNQGADGFVWDAEAEWESNQTWIGTNGPAKAWQLCSTVRSNWPTKFLAHAPFPIIAVHASFPYKEFGYWCDSVMPQIYHFSSTGIKGSPSACINWSDVNWASWQNSLVGKSTNVNGVTYYWTNAIKPLAPVTDVYGPPTGQPRAGSVEITVPNEDVREFIDYLATDPNPITLGGYKGVSFWRSDEHSSVQWAYIKDGTSGSFTGTVNNIVIDDPKASVVGAWTAVKVFGATTGAPTYYGATGTDTNSFGTNYLSKVQGSGSAYVQFTPNIITAGDYDMYQWHPERTNASASVPHVITYNGGTTTVNANQQTNSGNWTLLGRFNFAAGTSGNIRVTDGIPEAGAVAIADGIKLVYVAPASNIPTISTQPQSQTVVTGQTAAFNVSASGAAPLKYNWRFNGTNIAGATTSSYSRANIQTSDLGNYNVVVTNTFGAVTSAPAALTMETIIDNTNAVFSPDASWTAGAVTAGHYGDDYRYASSVTSTATASGVYQPVLNAGKYDVYIWYTSGANRSTAAPWVISYNGGTTNVPANQQVNGSTWVLIASGINFASGSSGNVTLLNNTPDSGKIVMADAVRFVMTASLAVSPTISTQPQSQAVNQGANLTSTVTANGTAPLSYQWRKTGNPIGGATASSFTINGVQPAAAGSYSVVVSNSVGIMISSNATLVVRIPPGISTQPQNQTVRIGSNVTFTVTASGSPTLIYQWNLNGNALAGATTSSYAIASVQSNQAGTYSVVITNVAGTVNSSNAVLTVTVPQSAHIDQIITTPEGGLQMILSGETGGSYTIEGSSNLVSWVTVTNVVNSSGTTEFTDGSVTNNPLRFYRARLEP